MSGFGGTNGILTPTPWPDLPDVPIGIPEPGPIYPPLPLPTPLSPDALAGTTGGSGPGDPLLDWLLAAIGPSGTGPTYPTPPLG